MSRQILLAAPVLVFALAGTAPAQRPVDHPRLRAALHELREARKELQAARDTWPPGHKDRALASTQEAINSLKTLLAVKDVDTFRGVDRNPDFYGRYKDQPRLRAALQDLRDARDELRAAKGDFAGLKDRAMDDIDVAVGDVVTLLRHNRR